MKRILILLVFGLLVLLQFSGCQDGDRRNSGIEVFIEGDGEFPQSLVGTWRANEDSWEFVFEPDGTISSAVISLGKVRIKPGQVTTIPMKMGGKGVIEPGEWMVYYVPADRELTVKTSLRNFHIEIGKGVLEGKSKDIFVGDVSEDGKFWTAEWASYPDYVAHTDEHPDFHFSDDPNSGIFKSLVFEKLTQE